MIAAAHVVAGVAIGSRCRRAWWVAVPAGFLSHFLLDYVPHSCFRILAAEAGSDVVRVLAIAGRVADAIMFFGVLLLAWRLPNRWVALAGGLAAWSVDPLNYFEPIGTWFAMLPGAWLLPWAHRLYHYDVTRTQPVLGFVTQAIVIGIGVYFLTRRKAAPLKAPRSEG